MSLGESVKKSLPSSAGNPRRLWLKKVPFTWDEGGTTKTMLLALAFHRRDLFAEQNVPTHFYLSVGLSDVNLKIEPANGAEDDPNLTPGCAKAIVLTIKETCDYFDNN